VTPTADIAPLAATMGDPAGVGPELIVRAFAGRAALGLPNFFAIGDPDAFARASERAGIVLDLHPVASAKEIDPNACALQVLPSMLARPERPGQADPDAAPAIVGAIDLAVAAIGDGRASGLVTAPIEKASLYAAGFQFPGHTEYVAHLTRNLPFAGARGPVMLLAGPRLKVALATIHIPLMRVAAALSIDGIANVIRVSSQALVRDFGIAAPRIVVAGLNPHAGEGGAIGTEDRDLVAPAVEAVRAEGIDVRGPISGDALFHEEARRRADLVVALYHDQGLIPAKALDLWETVNVTIGLPVVRTSPDHGTAYDIAGAARARIESFCAALRMAAAMARSRAQTAA
jgi:4-hydroxythreonine-4-phosphate dehydrogenase